MSLQKLIEKMRVEIAVDGRNLLFVDILNLCDAAEVMMLDLENIKAGENRRDQHKQWAAHALGRANAICENGKE